MRGEWTEERGRAVVMARSSGKCEGCGQIAALEFSHRIARSRGGGWEPSNGLALERKCHQWAHAHPDLARAAGWHLDTNAVPAEEPAWLRVWLSHSGGWIRLEDTGLYVWVDPEGARPEPEVPPWANPRPR